MLSQDEKLAILSEFPNIKLSYETIVHKKVYHFDIAFALPEGKKCFAWFTLFKDKPTCFLLELDNKNKKEIKNIKIINSCFSSSLCYGTVLYGTFFYHLHHSFFSMEDLFMYKGQDLTTLTFYSKFNKICTMLKHDIQQIAYNNSFVVFGLPAVLKPDDNIEHRLQTLRYKLHGIKYCNHSNNKSYLLPIQQLNHSEEQARPIQTFEKQNMKQSTIFKVKPDVQNDIYHVYLPDDQYVGLAAIPDYKTSVMMNQLFRHIKENTDLDALEESDDDDEFENPNADKFVSLDKSYKMVCTFNHKFKKWVPITPLEI